MIKLTQQEERIVAFLVSKQEVFWEELAQFCKNPSTVKLKTIKKIISDLKKKYKEAIMVTGQNIPLPFNCLFKIMPTIQSVPKMIPMQHKVEFNGQTLVQVKLTKLANPTSVIINPLPQISTYKVSETPVVDFILKHYTRQVITRSGTYALNADEFELCEYFNSNRARFVSLDELRDKVCYPKFGSKTPPRWFDSIQRRISNIRQQIPETKMRLLTVKQNNNSGYIFN